MKPATFRMLRLRLGIRQSDAAQEIGVSRPALCQFEAGRENAISPWRVLPFADKMRDEYQKESK